MKIIIFICICLLYTSCKDRIYKSDYHLLNDLNGLKGKIISVKDTSFYASDKFGEPFLIRISGIDEYNFDNSGNVVRYTKFNDKGNIEARGNRIYEKGKIIQHVIWNGDGGILLKEGYEYNGNKKIIHGIYHNYSGTIDEFNVTYENGERIEYSLKNNLDSLPEICKMIDKKENVTKWVTLKGDKIIEESVDSNFRTYSRSIFKRDGVITCDGQYWYNENGLIAEKKVVTGEFKSWHKYKYDKNNNLIELKKLLDFDIDEEETITYFYKYDNRDNWIEKIKSENGKISELTKRHIEYK